jgi:hypothetical protein
MFRTPCELGEVQGWSILLNLAQTAPSVWVCAVADPKGLMESRPFAQIRCRVCGTPVDLGKDLSADESGNAVHTECYAKLITGPRGNSPAICFAD